MRGSVLSKQILRSGTSIGANVKEAIRGQSKPDFYAKLNIALKEASETEYWLELLHESEYIEPNAFQSIYADCQEIIRLLGSIANNVNQIARRVNAGGTVYKEDLEEINANLDQNYKMLRKVMKSLSKIH